MAQRDRQADERSKLRPETMHRRDMAVEKPMVDLLTTVQGLTLEVKIVLEAAPNRLSYVPVVLISANKPSTGAFLAQQPTYQEVFQRHSGTQSEQTKQPKL